MKLLSRFCNRRILAVCLTASAITIGLHLRDNPQDRWLSGAAATLRPSNALAALSIDQMHSVADVTESALAGVVNVSSVRKVEMAQHPFFNHPFFRDFFGGQQAPPERLQRGLGSGVIVDSKGIILTNNHVVEKADEIRVTLPGYKREFEATIVGTDPKSDLAVLRLESTKGIQLQALPIGDSSAMRLGDVVLAIGNPFGVGQTVTMGIVSAKGRANVGIVEYEDFIQTDAAINPGNSGGALVNMKGELVGINTAILSRSGGYQGIGFAIPTNMARPIMESLLKDGKVHRGWLGVVIQDVDEDLAKALKLPTTSGVLVSDVDPKGPAANSGLKRGDLITKINGQAVSNTGQLRNRIAAVGANGRATIEYLRGGKRRTLKMKLSELPERLGGAGGTTQSPSRQKFSGLSLAPLNDEIRQQYQVPKRLRYGLVIRNIDRGTKAAEAGLRKGDVILEANQAKLTKVSTFAEVYEAADSQLLLLVYRRGSTLFLLLPKK